MVRLERGNVILQCIAQIMQRAAIRPLVGLKTSSFLLISEEVLSENLVFKKSWSEIMRKAYIFTETAPKYSYFFISRDKQLSGLGRVTCNYLERAKYNVKCNQVVRKTSRG